MPTELQFVVPANVEEAVRALAPEGAMAVGGGTAMALLLKNRLIEPESLVYLGRIAQLSGISVSGDGDLVIGATTTLREVVASDSVREHAPVLAVASRQVGNPRVRAVATIGGAAVHADPRQDVPPALVALGARATVVGPSGERHVEFEDFFHGFMETAVAEDELVTEVVIPLQPGRIAEYSRFTPGSADDYPTVGVAANLSFETSGEVRSARIALGGVGGAVVIATQAANGLIGSRPQASDLVAAAEAASAACDPTDDQRGSAAYKRAMVKVWTRRTLERCLSHGPT